jgi:hypothetical protein
MWCAPFWGGGEGHQYWGSPVWNHSLTLTKKKKNNNNNNNNKITRRSRNSSRSSVGVPAAAPRPIGTARHIGSKSSLDLTADPTGAPRARGSFGLLLNDDEIEFGPGSDAENDAKNDDSDPDDTAAHTAIHSSAHRHRTHRLSALDFLFFEFELCFCLYPRLRLVLETLVLTRRYRF